MAELSLRAPVLESVLEVVDGSPGARQELPHRRELRGLGLVGGARDRELVVGQVVVGLEERNRLHRLERRAEEAVEVVAVRIARRGAHVHAVHRLNDAASRRTVTLIASTDAGDY